jgi:hypothetical protein
VAKISLGIAGGAKAEGTTRAGGMPGTAGIVSGSTPAVTRAMWLWVGAVAILFVFHVGGARLG